MEGEKKKDNLFEDLNRMAEDIENSITNPLAIKLNRESPTNWSFTVKYKLIKPNVNIHKEFCQFAREFADDNYLQAIEKLLFGWKQDWKYALIFDEMMRDRTMITDLVDEVERLKQIPKKEEKPKRKTFGKMEEEE